MFCLNKNLVIEFKKRLKSGEITPESLSDMTSQERRDYFKSFLGEANAQKVNSLFESKLLLKNQKKGIINWATKVTGISPQAKRDLISRVNRMTEVLTPENEDAFLEDLASQRLGIGVTQEEALNIATMAKKVSEYEQSIDEKSPAMSESRMKYGLSRVDFEDYVNDLKEKAGKKTVKDRIKDPLGTTAEIGGITKSLKASLDNSGILRQGWKVMATYPKIWAKNSLKTFSDIFRTFKNEDVMREIRADIVSRPNSINGMYKKHKLAVGVREEAFPTSLPERIPILGKGFQASEAAYTGFAMRSRADIFDKFVDMAEKSGVENMEGIGKLANSLTGRGALGRLEPIADVLNNLFFSVRFARSNIDALTAHAFDKEFSGFARKEAIKNTVKIVSLIAGVLAIANAFDDDAVEKDPRSANFGKIKVGNTRFDVSGGMSSYVVLASRIATQKSKSSVTGITRDLGKSGFGQRTSLDVVHDFVENKLSPMAGIVRDIMRNRDFKGRKPTIFSIGTSLITPIIAENFIELKEDKHSADITTAMLADFFGIGTNTYGIKADWTQNEGKELLQFKEKVGADKFMKANKEFNDDFNEWFERARKNKEYINLPEEKKTTFLSSQKRRMKKNLFRKYGFKYKQTRTKYPKID